MTTMERPMPASDPRLEHMRDINHLPKFDRLEIQHFFETYKDLEPGKSVEGANWVGRTEAEAEVRESFKRFTEEEGDHSGAAGHAHAQGKVADDRDALRKSGVKMYSTDAMCTDKKPPAPATFSQVKDEVTKVGQIFDVPDKAKQVNKELDAKISTIQKQTASGAKANAVALYITPGSTEFYTYGSSSMIEPMFAANGLRNMYHSNTTRVFDADMEDLLHKNPEWIVLLAGAGAMSKVEPTFLSFKGAKELKAVKKGHVVTMSFALTDPPTPLTITGTEKLHDLIKDKK